MQLLEDGGIDVEDAYGDASSLLSHVGRTLPDVVVTDIRMPPGLADDGVQAAREIARRWPSVGVLILSHYIEPGLVHPLFAQRVGGMGLVGKARLTDEREFVAAVRRVARGGVALDPSLVTQLVALCRREELARLDGPQRQLLGLVAEGLDTDAMAARMGLSASSTDRLGTVLLDLLGVAGATDPLGRTLAVLHFLDPDPFAG